MPVPMTKQGELALRAELERLISEERPRIIQAIAEAREHGDLKENAEYHAAREQQGFTEGRIQEIDSKLATAEIIDPKSLGGEKVVFGATVSLLDCESDEEVCYQIVGVDEADAKLGRISVTAPMSRALIGNTVGDIVTVRLPRSGEKEYEIMKLEFV